MPWQRLQDWIESKPPSSTNLQLDLTRPLTLATLSLRPDAAVEEVRFYRDAEFELLSHWAAQGSLLLALVSLMGNEITLLCPLPLPRMRAKLEDLPLLGAGLATATLRPVVPLVSAAGGWAAARNRQHRT